MSSWRPRGVNVDRLEASIFSDFEEWSARFPRKLDVLYSSPYAVQCVFRSLPPVARLYVVRVLYLSQQTPQFSPSTFRGALCRRQRARDRHEAAMTVLRNLRIFLPDTGTEDEKTNVLNFSRQSSIKAEINDCSLLFYLHPSFAQQLRLSIGCMVPSVFGGPVNECRDALDLDRFSAQCLERVLNFAIGNDVEQDQPSENSYVPCPEIQDSLSSTQILTSCDGGKYLKVSSVGFQFLLKESHAQIWILLRDIINNCYHDTEFEALNFVFQLSFATCGRGYSVDALSPVQQRLVTCLFELGIISLSPDRQIFFPTWLGVNLVSSASRAENENMGLDGKLADRTAKTAGDIHVIVETNFRLYAYTTSSFQMNLLSLFTHMRYQLPNLVVGHLTRDKAREALMNGITANQIISFLNSHAHPRMKHGTIPSNVRDEIKLWEAEQKRVQFDEGFLLSEFDTSSKFDKVVSYASNLGSCLWHSVTRRQLIVDKRDYQVVRKFVQSL